MPDINGFFNSMYVKYNRNEVTLQFQSSWILNLLIPSVHEGHRIRDLHSEKEYEAVTHGRIRFFLPTKYPWVRHGEDQETADTAQILMDFFLNINTWLPMNKAIVWRWCSFPRGGSPASFVEGMFTILHSFLWFKQLTLPEINIAPENGWLEDCFPIGEAYFKGLW